MVLGTISVCLFKYWTSDFDVDIGETLVLKTPRKFLFYLNFSPMTMRLGIKAFRRWEPLRNKAISTCIHQQHSRSYESPLQIGFLAETVLRLTCRRSRRRSFHSSG